MLSAGIRSWMLTGDKLETAVEVGKSCGLISPESKLVYLKEG
jgi:P-type E1-E2 ATPase